MSFRVLFSGLWNASQEVPFFWKSTTLLVLYGFLLKSQRRCPRYLKAGFDTSSTGSG